MINKTPNHRKNFEIPFLKEIFVQSRKENRFEKKILFDVFDKKQYLVKHTKQK